MVVVRLLQLADTDTVVHQALVSCGVAAEARVLAKLSTSMTMTAAAVGQLLVVQVQATVAAPAHARTVTTVALRSSCLGQAAIRTSAWARQLAWDAVAHAGLQLQRRHRRLPVAGAVLERAVTSPTAMRRCLVKTLQAVAAATITAMHMTVAAARLLLLLLVLLVPLQARECGVAGRCQ